MDVIFIFAAISVFTFSACSDDDNDTLDVSAVSNLVREAFNSKYPQAQSVEWEVKGNYAVASFHSEGTSHEAWYNPSSAEWYMTESDIPYEALPQPVKETFKQSEYAGWKIDDVDMLARAGMETIYVIEVEQGKQEVDLYYSPEGVLTRLKLIMIRTTMKISFPNRIWTISLPSSKRSTPMPVFLISKKKKITWK